MAGRHRAPEPPKPQRISEVHQVMSSITWAEVAVGLVITLVTSGTGFLLGVSLWFQFVPAMMLLVIAAARLVTHRKGNGNARDTPERTDQRPRPDGDLGRTAGLDQPTSAFATPFVFLAPRRGDGESDTDPEGWRSLP